MVKGGPSLSLNLTICSDEGILQIFGKLKLSFIFEKSCDFFLNEIWKTDLILYTRRFFDGLLASLFLLGVVSMSSYGEVFAD